MTKKELLKLRPEAKVLTDAVDAFTNKLPECCSIERTVCSLEPTLKTFEEHYKKYKDNRTDGDYELWHRRNLKLSKELKRKEQLCLVFKGTNERVPLCLEHLREIVRIMETQVP